MRYTAYNLLQQHERLAVGVGQVGRPGLGLVDLVAHPVEQHGVRGDQAEGGKGDVGLAKWLAIVACHASRYRH